MASDPALFSSYFWWRDFYRVTGTSAWDRARAPCSVCSLLHTNTHHQVKPGLQLYQLNCFLQVVEDIRSWWVDQANCSSLFYDREILADLGDEEDEDDYFR